MDICDIFGLISTTTTLVAVESTFAALSTKETVILFFDATLIVK
jgi:hypothetical protein